MVARWLAFFVVSAALTLLAPACGGSAGGSDPAAPPGPGPGGTAERSFSSSPLAVSADGQRLVTTNFDANTVTIFSISGPSLASLGQVGVGLNPTNVSIDSRSQLAYVVNQGSDSVSVLDLGTRAVIHTISGVGTEPYGAALAPNDTALYVACASSGDVHRISTTTRLIETSMKPPGARDLRGVAITNDGDASDDDETVFVTEFLAQRRPGGPGLGFDDGSEGRVYRIPASLSGATPLALPSVPSGIVADRQPFCVANGAANDTFCGGPAEPQRGFPNLLQGPAIAGSRLLVPSLGSSPEPPVRFDLNVLSLLTALDVLGGAPPVTLNLNLRVRSESPDPTDPLGGLFLDRPWDVAIHPTRDEGYVVAAGSNVIVKVRNLRSGAPELVARPNGSLVRIQVGSNPQGLTIHPSGTFAYVLNHVSRDVTIIDLALDQAVGGAPSSALPAPGTPSAEILTGLELFNTSRGPSAPGPTVDLRDVRFAMSDNGWGSCFNCHPFGLADGVTWAFSNGPRQTVSLDGSFSGSGNQTQRIFNWSAVRSSVQDFEKNTENVSGGFGLIGVNGSGDGVVDHGANRGLDSRADALAAYVQTILSPRAPPGDAVAIQQGRSLFIAQGCQSCHGGDGWTRSQLSYTLPASNDPSVTLQEGQVVSVGMLSILQDVGTFSASDPLEIRGAGPQAGQSALGVLGFNPPSLLGIHKRGAHGHDGRFPTVDDLILSGHGQLSALTPTQRAELAAFLLSIDDQTAPVAGP